MILSFKLIWYIGILSILLSCKPVKDQSNADSQDLAIEEQKTAPRILTLVFEINANDSVKVAKTLFSKGKLKRNKYTDENKREGNLTITFYNKDKNTCYTLAIPDPLKKKVEYSDDYRNMKAKTIELEKASFSIRVQFLECMQYLTIQKIGSAKNKTLLEIPLNSHDYE